MTSTHTGNPVCCAAALASLKKILRDDLAANAAKLEPVLAQGLAQIAADHPDVVGHWSCRGLVAGLQMVRRANKAPVHELAHAVIQRCFEKGLLLFAPVGAWGQTVKIAPPLTITAEALREGVEVLAEAVNEVANQGA